MLSPKQGEVEDPPRLSFDLVATSHGGVGHSVEISSPG